MDQAAALVRNERRVMSTREEQLLRAKRLGELLRAERQQAAESWSEEIGASESEFERIVAQAETPRLWEQLSAWLAELALPVDLLRAGKAAVRGEAHTVTPDPDPSKLTAVAGVQVQIVFENHHTEPVWVVTCEQNEAGDLSFTPEQDLATTPRVLPGDALTFEFTPSAATTMRVLAVAFREQPKGTPQALFSSPEHLSQSAPIASAKFTLRVLPAKPV